MSRLTPPMGISGAFILREPFQVDANSQYTVTALRTFAELIARAQDPLKLVYQPVGLGDTAYAEDQLSEAVIVCLRNNKTGALTYVPDTYIESFPSMGSIKYSRLVIGVSMGMWPDDRDITDIKQTITDAVQARIGVIPELYVARSSTTNMVTEQEHAQITQARQNAITNRETQTAEIIRLADTVAARDRTIAEQQLMIQALVDELNALNGGGN